MTNVRFSPLEETVLAMVGEHWMSPEELIEQLYPQFSPESVRSAISYLKRKALIARLERRYGTPLYEQTPLGLHILGEFRREHTAQLRVATV
jgi:hypothetical protein